MLIDEFLQYYTLNAPQLMWFLGAGTSRSAGMPSATDIIWDLKRLYYCTKENQSITDNELSNEAIKGKIQSYFDDLGCPAAGSDHEYSYFFKLVLGDDPRNHQKYLEDKLSVDKISINSGHRVLSALIAMNKARLIFTTNFDGVVENSYSLVTGRDLHAYALDGAAAVVNALNNEQFPIYAKMHGDFRYFELKNLPEQLIENDKEIQKCFLNATSRYGLVVVGYSGRDSNVMDAFKRAIQQPNAFPKGLFWITSFHGFVFPAVTQLMNDAKSKGINAHIIEADTFDIFLTRIWKLIKDKPAELDAKVRRAIYEVPNIARYKGRAGYPVIRTNAFPILQMPTSCMSLQTKTPLSYTDFLQKVKDIKTSLMISKQDSILYWGPQSDINKVFPDAEIKAQSSIDLEGIIKKYNSHTRSWLNRALAISLIRGKAIKLRKHHGFHAVVSAKHEKFNEIENLLKDALKSYNYNTKTWLPPKELAGKVPGINDTYWMESAELSLDFYDNRHWLVIKPDIWIEPAEKRKEVKDFVTAKKKNRYNSTQNAVLEAWKKILIGEDQEIIVSPYSDDETNRPVFKISGITAFSKRQSS